MKKNYLKMLLAALCVMAGSSAWADTGDVTTNANIDFSNAITDGVVAGAVNSMAISGTNSGITNGYLFLRDETGTVTIPEAEYAGNKDIVKVSFKKAWGNKNGMGSGFRMKDTEGEVVVNFQYARWGGGSNTLNVDMTGLFGSAYQNAPIVDRYTVFDISIDYATKKITTVVSCVNPNATKTFTADLTSTNPIATFEAFAYGVGSNGDRADMFDDLLIQTIEGDYNAVYYGYTVNWICDGTTVKTDGTRLGTTGSVIELTAADRESFILDGQKYLYVSDDSDGQTVKEDGSTVVNITMRKAATWNYTVNAVSGENILKTLISSTTVEGDVVSYGYPQYIAVDGVLYKSTAQSGNPWWGMSFTPTGDNEVRTVSYAQAETTGIVFCSEAEEIEGLTVVSGGNTDIRASNRQGAYAATDPVVITTLPAGKYVVYGATYGNAGTTFNITAGEETVLVMATNGNPVNTAGDEFLLTAETDIVLQVAGSAGTSPKSVDYIYIQKTGEATVSKSISAAGYATYCSPNALDFSAVEGLTAYIIDGYENGNSLDLVEVDAVPANTGVLLQGEEGVYNIPVAASADEVPGNMLVGVTEETVVDEAGIYVLMNEANGVGFYRTTKAFTVGANTAYLPASFGGAAQVKSFFGFDINGEATGIDSVEADGATKTVIYNLAGQRVDGGYKGIVIKNGKKVLMK